jgi:hypothetical protein
MQNSFGMNIASTTIALVGTVFLLIHLVLNNQLFKDCQSLQSPDLCIYMGSSSYVCFLKNIFNYKIFQVIKYVQKNNILCYLDLNLNTAAYELCNEEKIWFYFSFIIFDNLVFSFSFLTFEMKKRIVPIL